MTNALTLHQPWASLIAERVKWIETRSWRAPASAVGERLLIHAGAKGPEDGLRLGSWLVCGRQTTGGRPWLVEADVPLGSERSFPLPLGAIVASCRLSACVPIVDSLGRPGDGTEDVPPALLLSGLSGHMWLAPWAADVEDQRPYGDYRHGRWAWLLEDVERIDPPIPAKGRQGLWRWGP